MNLKYGWLSSAHQKPTGHPVVDETLPQSLELVVRIVRDEPNSELCVFSREAVPSVGQNHLLRSS